ncbi:MAG: LamG domain-containing protein [Bacteroidia bacterium]|nr:LamG domain-containing protein [Bacteroidia bacterium]
MKKLMFLRIVMAIGLLTVVISCKLQLPKVQTKACKPAIRQDSIAKLFPFPLYESPCKLECQILGENSFSDATQSAWKGGGKLPPAFDSNKDGCDDKGLVRMFADKNSGFSRISKNTQIPLVQGHFYQMGFCMNNQVGNAIRLKAFAYNGNPTVFQPGPDVGLIGVSNFLASTKGGWVQYQFPRWEANKDFSKVAIEIEYGSQNAELARVFLLLDNICMAEVDTLVATPDPGFSFDDCGNPVYPDWLNDLIAQGAQVTDNTTETYLGNVDDLYGHLYDLSTDTWFGENIPFDHNNGGGLIPGPNAPDSCNHDSLWKQLDPSLYLSEELIDSMDKFENLMIMRQNVDSILDHGIQEPIPTLDPPNFDCMTFDGLDDFIQIQAREPFQSINRGDFTIEMTINGPQGQPSTNPVLLSNYYRRTFNSSRPDEIMGFKIALEDNGSGLKELTFRSFGSLTNLNNKFAVPGNGSAGNLLDGRCHRISIIKKGSEIFFMVDRTQIGSFTITGSGSSILRIVNVNSRAFPKIAANTDNSQPFKGSITDFRVWSRARPIADVQNEAISNRYSYLEPGLSLNFELMDVKTQLIPSTGNLHVKARLGSSDLQDVSDPMATSCFCVPNDCSPDFAQNPSLPFGGRDIVYVHGLNLRHLPGLFEGTPVYDGRWPADADMFYEGDFQDTAYDRWRDHIDRELKDEIHPSNNYLVVSYPCGQRADVGVHAIVTQIKDAIETGRGVVWSNRAGNCRQRFGKEIVIVSHSTGGLMVSAMLGLGEMSASEPRVGAKYGNFKPIMDRVKAHVAFTGAFNGSPLARAAFFMEEKVYPRYTGPKDTILALAMGSNRAALFQARLNLGLDWLQRTILVDLEPRVAAGVWGKDVYEKATVPTVTAASTFSGVPANDKSTEALLTKRIIPGTDDGVLMMDCQCARKPDNFDNSNRYTSPSKFKVRPNLQARNLDKGIQFIFRGSSLYKEMTFPFEFQRKGNSCVSGLTTTGMLTWMKEASPHPRWKNHYSLIQSSGYHYEPWDTDPNSWDYYKSKIGKHNAYEESLVITDPTIYDPAPGTTVPLVNPDIRKIDAFERRRDLDISIPVAINPITGQTVWVYIGSINIWKRRYHLLEDYQNNDMVSYVYRYVLR